MRYAVLIERLADEEGMPGYYYAHVPSIGLTTDGPRYRGRAGCRTGSGDALG